MLTPSSGLATLDDGSTAEASGLGVSATPTFFVNGRQLADYRDGAMARVVEHLLAQPASN